MNRPLKLKFWCNEHGFVNFGFDEPITMVLFNQRDELGLPCPLCIKSRPMKLLLFTGLRDRNDIEIYDGDIIEDNRGLWQVKYSVAQFVAVPIKAINFRGYFSGPKLLAHMGITNLIVGNIYENPELVNG